MVQRTSNFLVWQLAFAEMVFMDVLWPDFDRRHLWQAVETYAARKFEVQPDQHSGRS
jgi:undecaprenyl diphosphate synthase